MKTTRNGLFGLWQLFNYWGNEKVHRKFAYTLLRNKKAIEPEITALQEASTPIKEYEEYQQKRIKCCEEFCLKDEEDKPVIKRGPGGQEEYDFADEQREVFKEAMDVLKTEHTDAITEFTEREQQLQELLAEEITIDVFTVAEEFLPEKITMSELETLDEIVRYED